jgi:hypothetical protein
MWRIIKSYMNCLKLEKVKHLEEEHRISIDTKSLENYLKLHGCKHNNIYWENFDFIVIVVKPQKAM